MRVKALVWLGIPVDDYGRAATFFTETLGLDVAFDEPHTMELSAANDDRIQLFGPGRRYFEFFRSRGATIVPLFEVDDLDQARAELTRSGPISWPSQSRMRHGRGLPSEAPTGTSTAWELVTLREQPRHAPNPKESTGCISRTGPLASPADTGRAAMRTMRARTRLTQRKPGRGPDSD